MNWRNAWVPLVGAVLVVASYRAYGWMGVAAAAGFLVMWLLLHFTRLMAVLRKAADSPIGHVGSAVMLNARLRAGVTLMHVIAMTRALGALQSRENEQPEVYRWTDAGGSHVTCEFLHGRLTRWTLVRPSPTESQPGPEAP
ncbi:MAG TPA: glycerate kinase [Comamonadaceae bacterium]|nr:MAG: glycerate kinase [Burkholderiales bacterium RIFCSPHIGHO2_12_63_9]OGB48115.1 MAG: glycerate kinase [Burkholderiales bacterium RIFCSPLOWO2_12_FULL_65_40]HCE28585.1 glycerate kinase [Comamonadaceae bacterium]